MRDVMSLARHANLQTTQRYVEQNSEAQERVVSGLERAKANGVRLGRKPVAPITVKQIHELRAKGLTQTAIAKKVGVSQAKISQILKGV